MKHEYPGDQNNEEGYVEYGIHEVYYYDNGKIQGWTEQPVSPVSESVGELKEILFVMMAKAFEKDILTYE